MGKITPDMLTMMRIKWDYLSDKIDQAYKQLSVANNCIKHDQSYFFIVRKNTFDPMDLADKDINGAIRSDHGVNMPLRNSYPTQSLPTRLAALEIVSNNRDSDTVIVATTGKTGRELFELGDHDLNLYMVGSMGCAGSLGLGIALAQPHKKVVVIDGDGAVLMRMGTMPTIAFYNPPNLLHIVLDNGSHDSTGGQFTVSPSVNFCMVSASVGYQQNNHATSLYKFQRYFKKWIKKPELTFLYLEIAVGSKENLGRPSIKPYQVKERLKDRING
jgi:phosphonopyruvate decarboxylase